MNKEWLFIILKRFAKGFLAGGCSSALLVITTQPLILTEWKSWLSVLITAFLTGGLLATEKLLQGYDPQ